MRGRSSAATALVVTIVFACSAVVSAQGGSKAFDTQGDGVLKDTTTGVLWTAEDNGEDVDWEEASRYCKDLVLSGSTDWRLPTIEQLKGLFDPSAEREYKTPTGIELTDCCVWSSTKGAGKTASNLNFIDGQAYSSRLGDSYFLRALCVSEP